MNVAVAKNETGRPLSDSFAIARDRLPGAAEARRAAFEAYERTGLPNRRIEDWKYTDLRALMRAGRSDAELSNAIAGVWQKRADRYSETRTINTSGLVTGARKVEMSYIGG